VTRTKALRRAIDREVARRDRPREVPALGVAVAQRRLGRKKPSIPFLFGLEATIRNDRRE